MDLCIWLHISWVSYMYHVPLFVAAFFVWFDLTMSLPNNSGIILYHMFTCVAIRCHDPSIPYHEYFTITSQIWCENQIDKHCRPVPWWWWRDEIYTSLYVCQHVNICTHIICTSCQLCQPIVLLAMNSWKANDVKANFSLPKRVRNTKMATFITFFPYWIKLVTTI